MSYKTGRLGVVMLGLVIAGVSHAEPLFLTQMNLVQSSHQAIEETLESLSEYQPIELAEPLKVSPFHHQSTKQVAYQRDFCISCHTTLPHRKSERLRSYLNMHVNHLSCASCHYRPEGYVLNYRWHRWQAESSEGEDAVPALITPYYEQAVVTPGSEHPDVKKQIAAWDKNDIRAKAKQHQQLHAPLRTEGTDCLSCHTSESPLLDYRSLDYTEDEIKAITNNRIARFLGDESFKDKPIKLMDLLQ